MAIRRGGALQEINMYTVTSRRGMTPWATCATMAEAERESQRAKQQGLDGRIIGEPEIADAPAARTAMLDMLACNDREFVVEWVCLARNVADATIDDAGNVWVGEPQPHHLSDEELVALVNTINAGV